MVKRELMGRLEPVLIIFLALQQVVVEFVEIVVIQDQGTRIMEVVMMQVVVIALVGGSGMVVEVEF